VVEVVVVSKTNPALKGAGALRRSLGHDAKALNDNAGADEAGRPGGGKTLQVVHVRPHGAPIGALDGAMQSTDYILPRRGVNPSSGATKSEGRGARSEERNGEETA
jgi:hypothetical protein